MKGINRIFLNPASVIEAIQEYLDRRAESGSADEVTQIKVYDRYIEELEVVTKSRDEE